MFLGELGPGECPSIDHYVAVRFNVHNHVADRGALFLGGRGFRNFDVELVFVPGSIKGKQEKDQKQKQHVYQRGQLNSGVNWNGAATKIHLK